MRGLIRTASLVVGALVAGVSCLPNPQSVKERRQSFDRARLKGTLLLDALPGRARRVDAEFGGRAKLLGYEVEPAEPEPGDRVHIVFYWTAIGAMAEDYQVFVHGDAVNGNASRIHGDHYPADGKYPTDVWEEGDVIKDSFTIWIPTGYGPKTLGIYTGLYLDNYRVPLTSKGSAYADNENRSRAVELNFR